MSAIGSDVTPLSVLIWLATSSWTPARIMQGTSRRLQLKKKITPKVFRLRIENEINPKRTADPGRTSETCRRELLSIGQRSAK
jgi:hypothetical protein